MFLSGPPKIWLNVPQKAYFVEGAFPTNAINRIDIKAHGEKGVSDALLPLHSHLLDQA